MQLEGQRLISPVAGCAFILNAGDFDTSYV